MDDRIQKMVDAAEEQRSELTDKLSELGSKVRATSVDWRGQFDRNPMLLMGVALGGGMLLGTVVARSRRTTGSINTAWSSSPRNQGASAASSSERSNESPTSRANFAYVPAGPSGYGEQRRKAGDTLEMIKGALIAFGTAKVKEFMSEALPGFNSHLEEAQRRHTGSYGDGYGSQSGGDEGASSSSGARRTDAQSPYLQDPVGAGSAKR